MRHLLITPLLLVGLLLCTADPAQASFLTAQRAGNASKIVLTTFRQAMDATGTVVRRCHGNSHRFYCHASIRGPRQTARITVQITDPGGGDLSIRFLRVRVS